MVDHFKGFYVKLEEVAVIFQQVNSGHGGLPMKGKWLLALALTIILNFGASLALAQFPDTLAWRTVLAAGDVVDGVPVGSMEGLTGDNDGNFYVADRGVNDADHTDTCNVWRINSNTGSANHVGQIIDDPCRPSGLTFGLNGDLFITTGEAPGIIYRLTPDATNPTSPAATGSVYATGVPGANGLAFLGGDLFVSDGTGNQGRVWKITSAGADCASNFNCQEFLRIQPRTNSTALGGNVEPVDQPFGVGSERYTVPRHVINPVNNQDRQAITANGIAFNVNGRTVYVADTSRGAMWQRSSTIREISLVRRDAIRPFTRIRFVWTASTLPIRSWKELTDSSWIERATSWRPLTNVMRSWLSQRRKNRCLIFFKMRPIRPLSCATAGPATLWLPWNFRPAPF